MSLSGKRDLFVLVADLDVENALKGLLARYQSLGIRNLHFDPKKDLLRFSGRDSGCCREAVELLRPCQRTHDHAIVFFDHHGSGREGDDPRAIEVDIESGFVSSGWGDQAAAIVFDPEFEIWVWSDSPHVASRLGWGSSEQLRAFLAANGWLSRGQAKPERPKEALSAALREKRQAMSARLFERLAESIGRLDRCTDRAFIRLLETLRTWFPP